MITIQYKPFKSVKKFYLTYSGKGLPLFLDFIDGPSMSYKLQIKPEGYVPKSGILLCLALGNSLNEKRVLDIGTGETGILAIHCAKHGAKEITACDIDPKAIKWAERNGKFNSVKNARWINSNLFEKIQGKYDLIVSNPPQMPMVNGNWHDSGGKDGRKITEKIIKLSPKFLEPDGSLVLLLFDFLGVDRTYDSQPSIFQLLKRNGFSPSVVDTSIRTINPSGKTTASIPTIKRAYPNFSFKRNPKGDLYHKIYIVKGVLGG